MIKEPLQTFQHKPENNPGKIVSSKGPLKIENAEEIALCTCMQSNHWPLCDATHHTLGGAGPKFISLDPKKTYYLCTCQHTKKSPYCDGSHETIG